MDENPLGPSHWTIVPEVVACKVTEEPATVQLIVPPVAVTDGAIRSPSITVFNVI